MQTFYPWGKESIGILLDKNLLDILRNFSQLCQTYYIGIEKRRNGSLDKDYVPLEIRDEISGELDQIAEKIKNQEPGFAIILENSLQKQSLIAALIAQILDFEYRVLRSSTLNGKCEVHGVICDRSGYKIETIGSSELLDPNDPVQLLGAFNVASKKSYVTAVGQLLELDLTLKATEVLI